MKTYPWYKKINPLWWFGNANDSVDSLEKDGRPSHPNFYPNKPLWYRKLMWGIRNPLNNLFFFVIGLEDRKEIVNYGSQWPKAGQKWNINLPFFSYRGKKWEMYLGWRNGTSLGAAFRRTNSKSM